MRPFFGFPPLHKKAYKVLQRGCVLAFDRIVPCLNKSSWKCGIFTEENITTKQNLQVPASHFIQKRTVWLKDILERAKLWKKAKIDVWESCRPVNPIKLALIYKSVITINFHDSRPWINQIANGKMAFKSLFINDIATKTITITMTVMMTGKFQ